MTTDLQVTADGLSIEDTVGQIGAFSLLVEAVIVNELSDQGYTEIYQRYNKLRSHAAGACNS